jgi:hypothetical protein
VVEQSLLKDGLTKLFGGLKLAISVWLALPLALVAFPHQTLKAFRPFSGCAQNHFADLPISHSRPLRSENDTTRLALHETSESSHRGVPSRINL